MDQELSAKLDSELQLEKDNSEPDTLPPNIKDFLDNSPFEVTLNISVFIALAHRTFSFTILPAKKKFLSLEHLVMKSG